MPASQESWEQAGCRALGHLLHVDDLTGASPYLKGSGDRPHFIEETGAKVRPQYCPCPSSWVPRPSLAQVSLLRILLPGVPGGVDGLDQECVPYLDLSSAEAQQAPSRVSNLHEGHLPPTGSPCIVRAFTSPSPPEALHKGCSRLDVPHLTQWDSPPPLRGLHSPSQLPNKGGEASRACPVVGWP